MRPHHYTPPPKSTPPQTLGTRTCAGDADRLQHAPGAELLQDVRGADRARHAVRVGLDAADVVRLAGAQRGHEPAQLLAEARPDRAELEGRAPAAGAALLGLLREQLAQEPAAGRGRERRVLCHHKVAVLVQQALAGVDHLARVVLDGKGIGLALGRLEAPVLGQPRAQRVRQVLEGGWEGGGID